MDGTVSSIAKFGAFVNLPERRSGLVHISEIASEYVADVNDFLQVGQAVKVKILAITPEGKINLSIKRAAEAPPAPPRESFRRPAAPRTDYAPTQGPVPERTAANGPSSNSEFEDRLKKFMQESDSRIADNRIYSEHRSRSRRR